MNASLYKSALKSPSADWAEATPLGNGRIGAMLYGAPDLEHIALNHDRLWRRYVSSHEMRTERDIDEIRALCRDKKYKEAELLFRKTLPYHERGCVYINPFVPFADVFVRMMFPSAKTDDAEFGAAPVTDYTRTLDMEHGTAAVRFTKDGVRYRRECFCPIGTRVCILRLTTDTPATLTGEISLSRMPDAECTVMGSVRFGSLLLEGEFDEEVRFGASVRVLHRGGRLTIGKRTYGIPGEAAPERHFGLGYVFDRDLGCEPSRGTSLYFDSADEVVLVIGLATDAECPSPSDESRALADAYSLSDIDALLAAHSDEFASYFNRTALRLSDGTDSRTFPELIAEAEREGCITPRMLEHLWHFSRYAAIASGFCHVSGNAPKAPIHLQGLWNRDTRPAWESDYHPDLNLAMCYQSLPSVGLADLYESVLILLERTLPAARTRAKLLFGAEGAHFVGCLDANGTLSPVDTILCGWLGTGAWYMQMLWQYYEYAPTEQRLCRIYSLMRECCSFYLSMLEEDADGKLTYPFGSSPEMGACIGGEVQYLTSASTIDLSLTRELLENAASAAERLDDREAALCYRAAARRIRPLPVDSDGKLMEWVEPHEEEQPGHRHRSPFVCFHPGSSITLRNAPETVHAMEKLLDYRIAQGSSMAAAFSYVLDCQLLARLGRGDDALRTLYPITRFHMLQNGFLTINDYACKGGLSWFAGTKVVQIEALLGILGAVSEMLLCDTDGILTPLPSLPSALTHGSFTGVRAKGGFSVDLCWECGALTSLTVRSDAPAVCRIDLTHLRVSPHLPDGAAVTDGILSLPTSPNGTTLTFG